MVIFTAELHKIGPDTQILLPQYVHALVDTSRARLSRHHARGREQNAHTRSWPIRQANQWYLAGGGDEASALMPACPSNVCFSLLVKSHSSRAILTLSSQISSSQSS